jgi:hypothetical protein
MKQAKVQFDEEMDARVFSSLQDLDNFLDDIHSSFKNRDPIIASIEMNGHNISLGLGSTLSFVQIINEENQSPYWITLGEENLEGETIYFFQAKHHTEIPKSYLIPIDKARDVIREFFMTGLRSTAVNWVEV